MCSTRTHYCSTFAPAQGHIYMTLRIHLTGEKESKQPRMPVDKDFRLLTANKTYWTAITVPPPPSHRHTQAGTCTHTHRRQPMGYLHIYNVELGRLSLQIKHDLDRSATLSTGFKSFFHLLLWEPEPVGYKGLHINPSAAEKLEAQRPGVLKPEGTHYVYFSVISNQLRMSMIMNFVRLQDILTCISVYHCRLHFRYLNHIRGQRLWSFCSGFLIMSYDHG